MAGSGIRYWNLARVLGAQQPVTLATPAPVAEPAPPGVTIVPYGLPGDDADTRGRRLAGLLPGHDIIVAQHLPYLYSDPEELAGRYLVVDLYAPWPLEKLEYARLDPERGEPNRRDDVEILNRLLALGDFFLCASERQRDYWLGALTAAGRLDLAHATADPELRRLIEVVPFGLPEQRPLKDSPGPRELFDGIGRGDPLILWNGGLWNWLDPLTAIRAVGIVAQSVPNVRLVFMGTRSPGAQVAEMEVVELARALSEELGLLGRNVFFNDWVAYDERQNWLLDADLTLSLHERTLEARYAFRTRLLDNLWCGVPLVATAGDVLADLIQEHGLGLTAAPGDAVGVAQAIEQLLDRDIGRAVRARIASVAPRFTWDAVAQPLLEYCRAPWRLGESRGLDAGAAYLQKLERLYTETAQYARDLERAIAEKDAALAAHADHPRERFRVRPFRRGG